MSDAWTYLLRWLPSPFLKASFMLHVLSIGVLVVNLSLWPLVLTVLVADHLILSTVGLAPGGTLLGPNLTRLTAASAARREVALTIDDGPDPEVTPRVLDILAAAGVRATFFCVGERVAAHPGLAREIVARGHAIENHTARHPYLFSLFGPWRLEREISDAQLTLYKVTGEAPAFFRAPAGLRNPLLQPILARAGLRLASWTRRGFDKVRGDARGVERRLLAGLAAGDILLLHDGRAARTADGTPVILTVLPGVLAAVSAAGLRTVTLREAFAPQGRPARGAAPSAATAAAS